MAAYQYYNRYTRFLVDGQYTNIPFVSIPSKPSDKRYIYKVGQSRLDKVSQQYYNAPYFGWVIMQANPQYGGLEWNIPDGAVLTIPFPLLSSLQEYNAALDTYFYYYGR